MMLKEVKTYYYDGSHPTQDVLHEAHVVACEHDCIVKFTWVNYQSVYSIYIDASDTIQTMLSKLPKVYPL